MKKFVFIFLILSLKIGFAGDNLYYLSPGIRLGWVFGSGPTLGGKLSVGVNTDPQYYNLTFGFRVALRKRSKHPPNNYSFVQVQTGYFKMVETEDPFLGGLGAGFKFFKDKNKMRMNPMVSLSYGFLFFGELDLAYSPEYKTTFDLGVLGILPIPLRKEDFSFD